MSDALLRADGISVQRRRRVVLEPCDLLVRAGEVIGIYGPNGAGKSTLLQALAGLLPLASGQVFFQGCVLGRDLPRFDYHRRTAVVFQEALLLRGTVWQNVTLGLSLRGIKSAEHARRVQPWLERLKIAHLAQRPVRTLSGGEAQRASLARALVLEPEILFLDEPFAALDAPSRFRLVSELADILTERRIAAVFVTHDLAEASDLCHRCLILDQGRVLQEDDLPSLLHRPRSRRVAEITGTENIFAAVVAEVHPYGIWLDWQGQRVLALSCDATIGTPVTFVVPPEEIQIDSDSEPFPSNRLPGWVEQIRRRGQGRLVSVRIGNPHMLHIACAVTQDLVPGQEVIVTFPPHAVWVLPLSHSGR